MAADRPVPVTAGAQPALSSRSLRAHRRRTLWEDARNLPNLLTFLRVLMIPVVLLLPIGARRATVTGRRGCTRWPPSPISSTAGWRAGAARHHDRQVPRPPSPTSSSWRRRWCGWCRWAASRRGRWCSSSRARSPSPRCAPSPAPRAWSSPRVRVARAKTALQMIGIICLLLGYPYDISLGVIDFGRVDLVHVGRLLIYCSLFFSITSAARYMGFFADAIDAKKGDGAPDGTPIPAGPTGDGSARSPADPRPEGRSRRRRHGGRFLLTTAREAQPPPADPRRVAVRHPQARRGLRRPGRGAALQRPEQYQRRLRRGLICTLKVGYMACCPPTGSTQPACMGNGNGNGGQGGRARPPRRARRRRPPPRPAPAA